jgi:hypothetical protein
LKSIRLDEFLMTDLPEAIIPAGLP